MMKNDVAMMAGAVGGGGCPPLRGRVIPLTGVGVFPNGGVTFPNEGFHFPQRNGASSLASARGLTTKKGKKK